MWELRGRECGRKEGRKSEHFMILSMKGMVGICIESY